MMNADPQGKRTRMAEWLTVERMAYGAIALLGLVLRLVGLTAFPLGPAEATQAVEAVAAAAGRPYAVTGLSPLLFSGQRALFMAVGANELLARWWPALLGGLAVLFFYALRDRLTRGGALAAAFLWAVSPMAVFTGRHGLGDSLVPPLALALLACLNLAASRQALAHRAGAAAALGLLLASGPTAYTVVLIALAAALWWRADLAAFWSRRLLAGVRAERRGVLASGLGALILGSTFFLLTPMGLAGVGDLLGSWLRGLAPLMGEYGAWELLRRLLISEPLLLGFAVGGTVMAVRSRTSGLRHIWAAPRFGRFLGVAAAIALLIAVGGQNRQPTNLGLVVLTLALLAGPALAAALRVVPAWRGQLDPWLLVALELVLLATAALCLPSALHPATKADWVQVYTMIGAITFAMAVLLLLVYGVMGDWRIVAQALPVVLLVVGLAWGVSQLAGLNFDRGAGRLSGALVVMPDAGGLADLRSELRELTALKGLGAREARVDLVLPLSQARSLTPVLRWELRDLPNLRVAATLPFDRASIVITVAEPERKAAAPGETYGGADFTILQRWRPDDLKGIGAWVRWLLYREAATAAQPQMVVLWIDRSTFEGQTDKR